MRYGHLNNLIANSGGSGSGQGGSSSYEELPVPITNLNAVSNGFDSILLKWNKIPKSIGYTIAYKKDNIPTVNEVKSSKLSVDNNYYQIDNLEKGSNYGIWVVSKDENGNLQTARFDSTTKYCKTLSPIDNLLLEIDYPSDIASGKLIIIRTVLGDTFCSSQDSSYLGLYKLNMTSGKWDKVYDKGYFYNFRFVDKNGNTFISSGSQNVTTGLLLYKADTNTASLIYANNRYFNAIEYKNQIIFGSDYADVISVSEDDYTIKKLVSKTTLNCLHLHNDILYLACYADYNGSAYKYDGTTLTSINSGLGYKTIWIDASNGLAYTDGKFGDIECYDYDNNTLTQVIDKIDNVPYGFYDLGNGIIFVTNPNRAEVFLIENLIATTVSTSFKNAIVFKDSNENIYVSSSGIGKFNPNTKKFSTIYSSGSNLWRHYEDIEGNVYVWATSSNYGIYRITDGVVTKIYDSGHLYYVNEGIDTITFIPRNADSKVVVYNKENKTCSLGTTYGGLYLGCSNVPLFVNDTKSKVYDFEGTAYSISNDKYISGNCYSTVDYAGIIDDTNHKVLINLKQTVGLLPTDINDSEFNIDSSISGDSASNDIIETAVEAA